MAGLDSENIHIDRPYKIAKNLLEELDFVNMTDDFFVKTLGEDMSLSIVFEGCGGDNFSSFSITQMNVTTGNKKELFSGDSLFSLFLRLTELCDAESPYVDIIIGYMGNSFGEEHVDEILLLIERKKNFRWYFDKFSKKGESFIL